MRGANDLQQDRADNRADHRSRTAQDADPSDDRCGDNREFKTGSDAGLDRREVGGIQNGGHPHQQSIEGEHPKCDVAFRDARESRCFGISPDSVDFTPWPSYSGAKARTQAEHTQTRKSERACRTICGG